jgi:hypothetical protein
MRAARHARGVRVQALKSLKNKVLGGTCRGRFRLPFRSRRSGGGGRLRSGAKPISSISMRAAGGSFTIRKRNSSVACGKPFVGSIDGARPSKLDPGGGLRSGARSRIDQISGRLHRSGGPTWPDHSSVAAARGQPHGDRCRSGWVRARPRVSTRHARGRRADTARG